MIGEALFIYCKILTLDKINSRGNREKVDEGILHYIKLLPKLNLGALYSSL